MKDDALNKVLIITKDGPLYKALEKAEEEFRKSWLIKANVYKFYCRKKLGK